MLRSLQPSLPFFSTSSVVVIGIAVSLIFVTYFSTIYEVQAQAQAQAQGQQIIGFYANLSAKEEVPPIQSNATGLAVFLFNNASSELSYLVNTTGLEKITQSLIYNGTAGSNGESVASLSDKSTKSNSSVMFQGEIKKDDLNGPLNGNEIEDLVTLMSNGSAYVNIHSEEFKDGEIRGQIVLGEVQMDGNAITGILVPGGGLIGLGGITLQGGTINFSPGYFIGYLPILVGTDPQAVNGNDPQSGVGDGNTVGVGDGNTVGNVGEGVDGVVDKVAGIADKTINQLSGTVDEAGEYVGETVGKVANIADDVENDVDDSLNVIDERIVQKILDDDDDSKDSDNGDSSDSGDGDSSDSGDGDSSDSGDGDSKDSDNGDSSDSGDGDSKDSDGGDSNDSDGGDSKDSDDGDSKDSDDGDSKDSDDGGDSVTDKVKRLLD